MNNNEVDLVVQTTNNNVQYKKVKGEIILDRKPTKPGERDTSIGLFIDELHQWNLVALFNGAVLRKFFSREEAKAWVDELGYLVSWYVYGLDPKEEIKQ